MECVNVTCCDLCGLISWFGANNGDVREVNGSFGGVFDKEKITIEGAMLCTKCAAPIIELARAVRERKNTPLIERVAAALDLPVPPKSQ